MDEDQYSSTGEYRPVVGLALVEDESENVIRPLICDAETKGLVFADDHPNYRFMDFPSDSSSIKISGMLVDSRLGNKLV